ncbi:membrane associated rhomboid family serine protease [Microbacteriaceae bacterium SG_E_30_P1]|uniref:Membrane associated rhomboid family serine protease n=1 Tax=Antiquaquibacter oligotrophicus TaxID=2880260 RepID=A0ABT6KQS1_9MICO|nr:rhomboid family intramembrane serine protease [Antiquaquibacter oligotrophicus]MDH6182331.1 membrane associated rhomboid family serine protease [Antiquaquibacter oligotrophicus]UDF12016.1 rhomboid family intramembrane serine protease [Antiquaquibacter oligotrophicus]
MSDSAGTSSNVCYRHPNRQSYVLCQRCGRTICPECQTQAAVGVQCPECVREGRASVPRTKSPLRAAFSRGSTKPVVTWSIIAICVVLFVLQNIPVIGNYVVSFGAYRPVFTAILPWTLITSAFLHGSIFHILLNMYSLFIIGPVLERMLGRGRFLALYLLSALGGSVAVLLLAPASLVVGASGAIFGLLGAFFVIQRRLGGTNVQLLVIVGLNLVIGFVPGLNIAWQAHIGGLVAGAAVALVFVRTRRADQRTTQILFVSLIAVALVAITIARLVLPVS